VVRRWTASRRRPADVGADVVVGDDVDAVVLDCGDVVGSLAFCLLGSLRVAAARKNEAGSCFLRSVCSVQLRLFHTRAPEAVLGA
jgi:hypothetical protein